MNYYRLNRPYDFKRGYIDGCILTDYGCKVDRERDNEKGIFITRVFDSKEEQTVWHRIKFSKPKEPSIYQLNFYASDKDEIIYGEKSYKISQLIMDETIPIEEKEKIFKPHFQKTSQNQNDSLLHEVKGRYLWLIGYLFDYQRSDFELEKIQIFFPKDSFIKYLPALYQSDPESTAFLERFLAVFQSFYDEMSESITNNPYLLDPHTTNKDFLYFLADLIGVENAYGWDDTQLRNLVANSGKLYEKRGTKDALSQVIKLVTGDTPCIIEGWQIKDREDLQKRFYSTEPSSITVLLDEKHLIDGKKERILSLISAFTPVGVEVNLKQLRQSFLLGQPLYLGVNTKLTHFEAMKLDGLSRIDYSVIGN